MIQTKDNSRFFIVEQVAATELGALLVSIEKEGHTLIHIHPERHGARSYRYTCIFQRKEEPRAPSDKFPESALLASLADPTVDARNSEEG